MSSDTLFLLGLSFLTGLLFIALAIPLIQKRIPKNHWFGLRIPATFANERVWYEANARMGRELLLLGILSIVLGILLSGIATSSSLPAMLWAVFLLGGVILVTVRGWRFANRLLEEYTSEPGTTSAQQTH